ncbi:MAG: hypothetical protein CMH54_13030, partial [Myxococcales bacterium]|nr:hypothetical protein [Myxococcales bacterium]
MNRRFFWVAMVMVALSFGCGGEGTGPVPADTGSDICVGDECEPVESCGDQICGPDESSTNCCTDCGCAEGFSCIDNQCSIATEECGNGICEGDLDENCTTCPLDCGCGEGQECLEDGSCCEPDCNGQVCGEDGCGGSCGSCPLGTGCLDGQCVSDGIDYPHLIVEPPSGEVGNTVEIKALDVRNWTTPGLWVTGPCGQVPVHGTDQGVGADGIFYWTYEILPLTSGTYSITWIHKDTAELVALESANLVVSGSSDCPTCNENGICDGAETCSSCPDECSCDQLCSAIDAPCVDVYAETQICATTGAPATVLCTRNGI